MRSLISGRIITKKSNEYGTSFELLQLAGTEKFSKSIVLSEIGAGDFPVMVDFNKEVLMDIEDFEIKTKNGPMKKLKMSEVQSAVSSFAVKTGSVKAA